MNKMKKYKISILIDKANSWPHPYVKKLAVKLSARNHIVNIFNTYTKLKKADFLFIVGYTKKIPPEYLKLHKHNLIVHESGLPQGRGFAPLFWQVLEGKNKIPIVLFDATAKIDAGPVFMKDKIILSEGELNNAIRDKQGKKTVELLTKFVDNYEALKSKAQKGKSSFYRRRTKKDSRLDINKTIAEQFNLLRIVDNECYPAFFNYKGHTYILKIYNADGYPHKRNKGL